MNNNLFLILVLLVLVIFSCSINNTSNQVNPNVTSGKIEVKDQNNFSVLNRSYFVFTDLEVGASKNITFNISNSGKMNFNLIGIPIISISGNNKDDFETIQPVSNLIEIGKELTFQIKFNRKSTGTKTAVISLKNNCSSDGDFQIHLVYQEPVISSSGSKVEMQGFSISLPDEHESQYTVKNLGKISTNDTNVLWQDNKFEILPGGVFEKPVNMIFDMNKIPVPDDVDKNNLSVCYLDVTTDTWKPVTTVYDSESDKIIAWTNHFSTFCITYLKDDTYTSNSIGSSNNCVKNNGFHEIIGWQKNYTTTMICGLWEGKDADGTDFKMAATSYIKDGNYIYKFDSSDFIDIYDFMKNKTQYVNDYIIKNYPPPKRLPKELLLNPEEYVAKTLNTKYEGTYRLILWIGNYGQTPFGGISAGIYANYWGQGWYDGGEIGLYKFKRTPIDLYLGAWYREGDLKNFGLGSNNNDGCYPMEFVVVNRDTNDVIVQGKDTTYWLTRWGDTIDKKYPFNEMIMYYKVPVFWGDVWMKLDGNNGDLDTQPVIWPYITVTPIKTFIPKDEKGSVTVSWYSEGDVQVIIKMRVGNGAESELITTRGGYNYKNVDNLDPNQIYTFSLYQKNSNDELSEKASVQTIESVKTNLNTSSLDLSVSGDFNNDGLSDIAIFNKSGDSGIEIKMFKSNRNGFDYDPASWYSCPVTTINFNNIRSIVNGDFDNDGLSDDIAFLYDYGNGSSSINTLISDGGRFKLSYFWLSGGAGTCATASIGKRMVSGDFDNDGKNDDIAFFYDYGNGTAALFSFISNGEGFSTKTNTYTINLASVKNRFVNGDFDNDGFVDDVAFFYDYGNSTAGLLGIYSNGNSFGDFSFIINPTSGFDISNDPIISGNFDNDGYLDDITFFHDYKTGDVSVIELLLNKTSSYSTVTGASYHNGLLMSMIGDRIFSGNFINNNRSDIAFFNVYQSELADGGAALIPFYLNEDSSLRIMGACPFFTIHNYN